MAGSGFAARPLESAPRFGLHSRHPSPQAAVAACGPWPSAEDPLLRAGVFVPLTNPLHLARQRESRRPVPASSGLRSHAQVSITLKVGATLGTGDRAERDVLSVPCAGEHPTLPPNSPARTAPRAPGHVPSPNPTQWAFGACGSHWPLSELARREAGRKEESDLKSHSSSLTPPKTSRGARRRGTRAGAPSAPQNKQRRSSRDPRSQTPSLVTGGRSDPVAAAPRFHTARGLESLEQTRRWRRRAGRGPRGPAAAPAPPPPPLATPLPVSLSAAAAARSPPGAQLPSSPAGARAPGKGGGAWRVGTSRDGGDQVMLPAAGVGGTLWFSALPERAGLFHPARR